MAGRLWMLPSPGSFMRFLISEIAQPFSVSMERRDTGNNGISLPDRRSSARRSSRGSVYGPAGLGHLVFE
jgi:hypothetical protein